MRMYRPVVLSCFLFQTLSSYFDSLTQVADYASKITSDTPNQSVETYRPQFNKFHRAVPGLTQSGFFSLRKKNILTEFKETVNRVAQQRQLKGLYGDFIRKFYIEDQTRWYIWGALHGSFHSLVRALLNMKRYDLIDEHMVLKQATTHLVFNGNILNYGPYQIETLLLILQLYEKNPSQVFLMQGPYEQSEVWKKTNFLQELQTRYTAPKEVPLEKELNALFNTFELALYLISTENDVVRISCYEEHPLLTEQSWGDFLSKKATETTKIEFIKPRPWEHSLKGRIVTHEVKQVPYRLESVSYTKEGPQTWSLFSSPVNLFRAYYDFSTDAVIELVTGRFFSSWTLTLYEAAYDDPQGFLRSRVFDIATGRETFTKNPEKRIEDLSEKLELADLERSRLLKACKINQEEKEATEEASPDSTDDK